MFSKIIMHIRPLVYILFLSLLSIACSSNKQSEDLPTDVVSNPNSADNPKNIEDLPVISFEKDFHDFGKLISGEKVTYSFKFINKGKSMLLISDVSSSCGCTVPDFPKKPIKPGETGSIDVSFDSEGRHGLQSKSITVFSNCQPPVTTLRIQSTVVETENL